MATPTFTLPTSGSDPKRATKEGLEENINQIIQYLDDMRIRGDAAQTTGLNFQGPWDASTELFPSVNLDGDPVSKGDFFWVSVEATFGGETYLVDEPLVATTDNPSTVDKGDWYHAPVSPSLVPIIEDLGERALDYGPRNATNAAKLALNGSGTIGWLGGLQYVVSSGGTVCSDIGVTGLEPFGRVSVAHYGCTGSGSDEGDKLDAALSEGHDVVYGEDGVTYKTGRTVNIHKNTSVKNLSIDANGSTGTFTNNAVCLIEGGVETALPDLSANVSAGDLTLTFASAHGLVAGDVGIIYDPSDYSLFKDTTLPEADRQRDYYRDGEKFTVGIVVSTTEITLKRPLYSDYLAADVSMLHCDDYATGDLTDFTVVATGNGTNSGVQALKIDRHLGGKFDRLDISGGGNISMSTIHCFDCELTNSRVHQWDGDGSELYGWVYANCQDFTSSGCTFHGGRHGVSGGGADDVGIPCRNVVVTDFSATNQVGDIASADWHGNCLECEYSSGRLYIGGANIAGNKNRLVDLVVHGNSSTIAILGREILGCDHLISNFSAVSYRDDTTRGIIDIGGNSLPLTASTRFGGTFVFKGITIDAPNQTRSAINIRNRGAVVDFDVVVDGIEYRAPSSNSASFGVLALATVAGSQPNRVQITDVTVLEGYVTPPVSSVNSVVKLRLDPQQGVETVATGTGATANTGVVTFGHTFPRIPVMQMSINLITTDTVSGVPQDILGVYWDILTAASTRAIIRRIDVAGGSFAADADINVNWTASIWEW